MAKYRKKRTRGYVEAAVAEWDDGGNVSQWVVIDGDVVRFYPTGIFEATYEAVGVAVKPGDWVEQTEDGLRKCDPPVGVEAEAPRGLDYADYRKAFPDTTYWLSRLREADARNPV